MKNKTAPQVQQDTLPIEPGDSTPRVSLYDVATWGGVFGFISTFVFGIVAYNLSKSGASAEDYSAWTVMATLAGAFTACSWFYIGMVYTRGGR